ncbi:SDR family oxidoreductase [Bacillus sp. cl95]|uniref:SDR family oxidoreductase n=1 Tax=Bacillus sp. cl95 TaxID=1761761 RepID=UPI0008E67EC7|nr:SDR family oxidoreductase [Bacillus sp. cl95]SFB13369.1 3-oxoacyl-[acyl-carrier protein] reductase [Bacillus sp. UNCCL13]SFQ90033.1 3-oxoacyl-[acyl-carrier protein] reductase [Bacillus sp. cl95]
MQNLNGKIAIVTGATRLKGIGAAICKELAAKGAHIFFTYWKTYDVDMPWGVEEEEPANLQKEIRSLGVKCEKIELDLSLEDSAVHLFDEVEDRMGRPDILINNATFSVNDTYETISGEALDKHYAVNVRATTLLSSEFSKRFDKGKGGRVINMSSGQALGKMSGEISYAITKGAVETLTYTLSSVLMEKGITINAVDPGPTDTGWMNDELEAEIAVQFPLGRVGQPKDAARLIAFLASDEAEWITGQIIHSEGGFSK